ncbi:MAG: GTPase, partial [Pseudomonadales bacterium]|nr:GTPase [Pseudomonadales bacterium]
DKEMAYKTESSVESPYKQVLLLGCCKPNQLRQNDLNTLYNVLEHWADQVQVRQKRIDNALFVINMKKDAPPVYRSLVHSADAEQYYGLDTANLVKQISDYLNNPNPNRRNQSSDGLAMPEPLSDQIMAHLAQSLGVLAKRTFKRIASQGNLLICVGMSATHYYSAGETEFNKFMINASDDEEEGNKFLNAANKKNDAWGGAFDAGAGDGMPAGGSIDFAAGNSEEERKPGYKVYKIPLINTSPGGYCLHWTAEMPGNIQTGEILGVKEPGVEGWSIAAIRWIRQIKQQGTQLGVELLAPTAGPCGIQLLQKTGDNSEFLRALILPELTAIGQPATVITPRLPFQTGQKVMIFENGSSQRCQLVKRVSATGSYSRFEIKYLDGMMPFSDPAPSKNTKSSTVEDDFDSLWPSL